MKDKLSRRVGRRTLLLSAGLLLWFAVLILRLVQLQVIEHPKYQKRVLDQKQNETVIIPDRGTIYDRSGVILARSIPATSIALTYREADTPDELYDRLATLSPVLKLDSKDKTIIRTRIKNEASFIYLKRKVDPKIVERIRALQLEGIVYEEEPQRFYPQKTLAAHVLGRVDRDGLGQSGIERSYDTVLGGEPGRRLNLRDARQRNFEFEILERPVPGMDIYLALDETIQYYAMRALEETRKRTGAKWGTAIVSHPVSGEILAMVTVPGYDSNDKNATEATGANNKAIHYSFDPGSTFKIVTATAALESERFRMNETFDCSLGYRQLGAARLWDHKKMGHITFAEMFIHSSNVGVSYLADRLQKDNMYQTIKDFGFGQKTGIDLPAEHKGIFHPPADWTKYTQNYLSVGYEINVTAVQLLQALNIVANRGLLVPLHMVKDIPQAPEFLAGKELPMRRIFPEHIMDRLTALLTLVVSEGTGIKAQVPGYSVAGKTGTAQKRDPVTGSYTSKAHRSSFMGFLPVDNPVLSIIVVVDDPQGVYYGGDVAAPVFREIAEYSLRYLQADSRRKDLQQLLAADFGRKGP